jgi:hypothetical protein
MHSHLPALVSSSNAVIPGWEQEQRTVGGQDLTVFMRAPTQQELLASMLQRLNQQEQRLNQLETSTATLVVPRISNVAAQALRHAAGEAFRTPECSRFTTMGSAHPCIIQLSTATSTPPDNIVTNLDLVIESNIHSHFTSTAALETEVTVCKGLLAANGTLRQLCRWEIWVLDNFHHIKAAFYPALG